MKKIIYAVLACLAVTSAFAQQDLTLYNMRYLHQAGFTNPAFTPECKVTFSGPLVGSNYFRAGNSGFTINKLRTLGEGPDKISKVLDRMGKISYLDFETRRDWLHVGFRVKEKNYFSINVSTRFEARFSYSKNMGAVMLLGNGWDEAEAAEFGLSSEYAFLGKRVDLDGTAVDVIGYNEIGLQYARKLLDDKLAIGIRPKLLLGFANVNTAESVLGMTTDAETFALTLDGSYEINTSFPVDTSGEFSSGEISSVLFDNMGFGLDVGASFDITEKFQVSASVTDLGRITWKTNATTYKVENANVVFEGLTLDGSVFSSDSDTSSENFGETMLDSIVNQFGPDTTYGDYSAFLSPRINVGANYSFNEKSNVGLLLNGHVVKSRLRGAMTLSYNYRVFRKVGFSANYSINNRSFLNLGLGGSFNLGPWQAYLMFDNVIPFFVPSVVKNAHVRFGVNWNIGCKTDKDKDGIKDKDDDCPDVPGVPEFKGCPDTDGDGIQDSEDDCPEEKGSKELNGCPDRDGDGIMDSEDKCPDAPGIEQFAGCPDTDEDGIQDSEDECPTVAGVAAFNGCPDTDEDGIRDSEDDCPEKAGLAAFNGCPDTDGDGIQDSEDACPEKPGPAQFQGCPDTDGDGLADNKDGCPEKAGPVENNGCPYGDRDGDGVVDKDDSCPDTPGPAENKGCPYADLDGDGVLDKDDACIDTPGPVENNGCPYSDLDGDGVLDKDDRCPQTPGLVENEGCPKIEEEEQEVLNTAFDNLEFETGKDVIKSSSFESLDALAELLIKKEDWKIQISGHTDNVGNDASNMALSEKRAKSVGKYLESKGVMRDKMIIQWFGETKPIADNSTPEGRAKNRRVEMEVVFD